MTEKNGVARLRRAIENQAAAGEMSFSMTFDEASALLRECEDEIERLAWAEGVPAPLDAKGRTVPLDTRELVYKGETRYVYNIAFIPTGSVWSALLVGVTDRARLSACTLSLPDSWEALEQDARKTPREYTEGRCVPVGKDGRVAAMVRDLVRRAKALAGVTDGE